MTPKEQAEILVAKFDVFMPRFYAKQAAIVAAELMIDNTPPGLNGQWLFWTNVKNELKEL